MTRTKHSKPVSLKFLAEHLGLSQGTVSMALSANVDATGVALKTRERVLKAAARFQYRPNHHARSLSKGKSNTIGVIVPAISEGYYSTIISSIETHLLEQDYFFFVTSHRWNHELLDRLPELLMSRGAEGIILINTTLDRDLPVPTVRIGGTKRHERSTNVCLNEERGAQLALEHLYRLGHRDIAFVRGEKESTATKARWEGIMRSAGQMSVRVRPELTIQLELGSWRAAARYGYVGYHAANELLAHRVPFTALFAYNDSTAIGAIRAFRDAGLRVPEDISVVGYDDIPSAEYERPALTTVRQPLDKMGQLAAEVLLRAIEGDSQPNRILVEPEMVVRSSTAAMRGSKQTRKTAVRAKTTRRVAAS